MTWTDEELVEQFREATYVAGSPLTATVRAWVAVKVVRDADVWRKWTDKYLASREKADAADAATYAAGAAVLFFDAADAYADAADYAAAADDAARGGADGAARDAATYAADAAADASAAIRRLDLDDPTLARYIREGIEHERGRQMARDEGVTS